MMVEIPISKLIKLRDRADRKDGFEADTAASMLREMLNCYGLDEVYLNGAEIVEQTIDEETDFNRVRLADALAKSRSCRAWVRKNGGIALCGPQRFVDDAVRVYQTVVDKIDGCLDLVAHARQSSAIVFKKVFWATCVDHLLLRLVPQAETCETPLEQVDVNTAKMSGRGQYDLVQRVRTERAEIENAFSNLIESFLFKTRDPYRAAAAVQAQAVSLGKRLAASVDLGEAPAWVVQKRIEIRGFLVGKKKAILTAYRFALLRRVALARGYVPNNMGTVGGATAVMKNRAEWTALEKLAQCGYVEIPGDGKGVVLTMKLRDVIRDYPQFHVLYERSEPAVSAKTLRLLERVMLETLGVSGA